MRASISAYTVIKHFEQLELKSYLCPSGHWTIGYGHTGNDIRRGLMISESRADLLLNRDVSIVETCIFNAVKVGLKQHQFDALVCFIFNVGVYALETSTMLKKLNACDYAGAALEFLRWDKADGSHDGKDNDKDGLIDEPGEKQRLLGLYRRRYAEKLLFEGANATKAIETAADIMAVPSV